MGGGVSGVPVISVYETWEPLEGNIDPRITKRLTQRFLKRSLCPGTGGGWTKVTDYVTPPSASVWSVSVLPPHRCVLIRRHLS